MQAGEASFENSKGRTSGRCAVDRALVAENACARADRCDLATPYGRTLISVATTHSGLVAASLIHYRLTFSNGCIG